MIRKPSDFDRDFNRTQSIVKWGAIVILVFSVCFFGLIGYGAFKIVGFATDPTAIGNYAGSVVRGFNDAADE